MNFITLSTLRVCSKLLSITKRELFTSVRSLEKVIIDNHTINYEVAGNGSKVLFCLPGALGTIQSDFGPQLKALPEKNIKVIVWDPPGYGASRPPNRQFDLNFFHNDANIAVKLMKHLNLKKYSVLGWSDGGITALILAGTHPQYIEKLVVLAGNAYVSENDIKIFNDLRDVNKWSERMRAPMEATYGKEYFKELWEAWSDVYISFYTKRGGDICKDSLNNIICPTLIIHGDKDPVVPSEHPKFLHENIKRSRLVNFENGKHNLHLRYPEEFNSIIADFVNN